MGNSTMGNLNVGNPIQGTPGMKPEGVSKDSPERVSRVSPEGDREGSSEGLLYPQEIFNNSGELYSKTNFSNYYLILGKRLLKICKC